MSRVNAKVNARIESVHAAAVRLSTRMDKLIALGENQLGYSFEDIESARANMVRVVDDMCGAVKSSDAFGIEP